MKELLHFIFEEYELHGASLEAMQLDFQKNEIVIRFEIWNSLTKSPVDFTLVFGGIFKFISEVNAENRFNPNECDGWIWTETEPDRFEAEFYFFSEETGWTVTIGFTSLRTEGGLSEEARAGRAAYLEESGD